MANNVNHTALYAVQAAVCLAQRPGQHMTAALIARTLSLPHNYLSKVLHTMAQCGLLESARGRQGGFRLMRPAHEVTLAELTNPFLSTSPARVWWLEARDQTEAFLETTTLQMLVDAERTNNGGIHVHQGRTE